MRRAILDALVVVAAALALRQVFGTKYAPEPVNLALWLLGGALIHDLVFLPAYALIDRAAQRGLGRDVNYLRVPAVVSGVILLVYFPGILDRQPANYVNALGVPRPDYLARWLWLTLALFAASALTWAARRAAAGRRASDR